MIQELQDFLGLSNPPKLKPLLASQIFQMQDEKRKHVILVETADGTLYCRSVDEAAEMFIPTDQFYKHNVHAFYKLSRGRRGKEHVDTASVSIGTKLQG